MPEPAAQLTRNAAMTGRVVLEVRVDGTPKAQPRPRAFVRAGHARIYDAGTAEGWKSLIALAVRPHLPPAPLTGPLGIRMAFTMTRPKSHYTTKGLRETAPRWHTATPDIDNLAKAVADCLSQLRVWTDDSLVAVWELSKAYGEPPGCDLRVWQLEAVAVAAVQIAEGR